MRPSYAAREREVSSQLAMDTVTDPNASEEDVDAARQRLAVRRHDSTRLDDRELRTLPALIRKMLGEPLGRVALEVVAVEDLPPWQRCPRCQDASTQGSRPEHQDPSRVDAANAPDPVLPVLVV